MSNMGFTALNSTLKAVILETSKNTKTAYISIIVGLLGGILLFPSPDFSKSILVGILFPASYFPEFVTQSLLFLSFIAATLLPVLTWKVK